MLVSLKSMNKCLKDGMNGWRLLLKTNLLVTSDELFEMTAEGLRAAWEDGYQHVEHREALLGQLTAS